ncbi:DUF3310 domain-containing protein [Marinobacterium sp. BA1]|uniref:DUF3310 domain-containing protein n=1 Tax=Marinobacterium sp. BA1 TaxID=3138931 RepID=UPI0032E6269E
MEAEMSRMDVVGQNGNDGLHYLEDAGDEQHRVDKRIEPVDQRPATAHYWSTGGAGHVPGWYKVAHDGEWWFWRTDRDCWLHAPCPADDVLNNLEALPPLDTATHVIGSYYFRLGQYGWEHWESGLKQWIGCTAPNPGSVDRVIHPRVTLNQPEIPDSSDHIPDAGKMIEGDPTALEAKRQQLKQDHSGDDTKMVEPVRALDTQEGGDHYKSLKIQPVEYIHANGIGYFEGCVIKYVTRWRSKNGTEDLRKARHFIDLLIELEKDQ